MLDYSDISEFCRKICYIVYESGLNKSWEELLCQKSSQLMLEVRV